jgi:hypothetical protein
MRFVLMPSGNGNMCPNRDSCEVLDPEQENGEPYEPDLPHEEEPVTAPEPDTLPGEPELTPPV